MTHLRLALCVVLAGCAANPAVRPSIQQAQVTRGGVPILIAEIPSRNAFATLVAVGRNGDVTTWRTADNVSVSLANGVLVATRGLGHDLMAADYTGTLSAMRGGPPSYRRDEAWLDGENRTRFTRFACTLSRMGEETVVIAGVAHRLVRHDETCIAESGRTSNRYWRDSAGFVRRSQVHPGPEATGIAIDLVTP